MDPFEFNTVYELAPVEEDDWVTRVCFKDGPEGVGCQIASDNGMSWVLRPNELDSLYKLMGKAKDAIQKQRLAENHLQLPVDGVLDFQEMAKEYLEHEGDILNKEPDPDEIQSPGLYQAVMRALNKLTENNQLDLPEKDKPWLAKEISNSLDSEGWM